MRSFAAKGVSLSNMYAVTHPSEPNYIAMIAGMFTLLYLTSLFIEVWRLCAYLVCACVRNVEVWCLASVYVVAVCLRLWVYVCASMCQCWHCISVCCAPCVMRVLCIVCESVNLCVHYAFCIISTVGDTFGVADDGDYNLPGPTIVDLLEAKGISWKVYQENLPGTCSLVSVQRPYYRKHNPFISFTSIRYTYKVTMHMIACDTLHKRQIHSPNNTTHSSW